MPVPRVPVLKEIRQKFVLPNKEKLKWFPGHMAGSIKKMQQKLSKVDCIVEVHDARIPISGRNPNFKLDFLGVKPHILILNKMDLADPRHFNPVIDFISSTEKIDKIFYANCKKEKSKEMLNIIPEIKKVISAGHRFNRSENREYGIMIIGVPNVGKSSLINCLRSSVLQKAGVAQVGARPGVTRTVHTRIRISREPPVFIYDTPGILTPSCPSVEIGMKLALCAVFQDHLVGIITIADFLLYWLNRNFNYCYMDYFGVNEPCDNVHLLLAQDAIKKGIYSNKRIGNKLERKPNIDVAAKEFVAAFRSGMFGPILLDADVLP